MVRKPGGTSSLTAQPRSVCKDKRSSRPSRGKGGKYHTGKCEISSSEKEALGWPEGRITVGDQPGEEGLPQVGLHAEQRVSPHSQGHGRPQKDFKLD